jgi:hypothetical protein
MIGKYINKAAPKARMAMPAAALLASSQARRAMECRRRACLKSDPQI